MVSEKPSIDGLRIDRSAGDEPAGRGRIWLLALAVVAVAAAATWLFVRPRPAVVRAVAAEERAEGEATPGAVLNASGYVTARRQATVSSKITGKVVEVLVEEGMAVNSGQVLARLDDATPGKQLALAQARLAAQRSTLAETEVRLKQARLSQQRMRRLLEQGVSTQAEVDAADAEVDSLLARLDVGRRDIEVSLREVALRRQDLEDTVIRAPFSGVAVTKDAQPGEMISPVSAGGGFTRTGICTVVDMKSLEIEVDVNEAYIERVVPGQRAVATLDAYPEWRIPTSVIMPVPTADRQKATVKVRLAFDELDPRLLPDMGVKVAFLGEEAAQGAGGAPQRVIAVPRTAVRKDGEQDIVFVVAGDRVERRAVRVSPAPGDEALVLSGLTAGERVVVEGPPDLADGTRVAVRNE
jgi:RND family efflux transporter MFP subunit